MVTTERHRWRALVWSLVLAGAVPNLAAGQTVTTVHGFSGSDGYGPGSLVVASDGSLYGTTPYGGAYTWGTVFRIIPDGAFTSLRSFSGSDGSPQTELVEGTDGNFYGTTSDGGGSTSCSGGCGTVFRLTPAGMLTRLHAFSGSDGSHPPGVLIAGRDGNVYGATSRTVFSLTPAGTLTTLHTFSEPEGQEIRALILGRDGNFYGATDQGGATTTCRAPWGCGTVFRLTPGGTLTVLHAFSESEGWGAPSLIEARDGNFYGTTVAGGATTCRPPEGCGTAFRLTPAGVLTTLHVFSESDGVWPRGLVQGREGSFYGVALQGGATTTCNPPSGCGTIFRLTPAGALSTLHTFDGSDGAEPSGRLVQHPNGAFYGTTFRGPATSPLGTVFRFALPPVLDPLPGDLRVGGPNTLTGIGFTPGSVVKLFVATASGAVAHGPYAPSVVSATSLTWTIPAEVSLGSGFGAVQVVNTDQGYGASNVVTGLLGGDPASGIPTILFVNGVGLGPADPSVGVAHIDTVLAQGATATIIGTAFSDPVVNLFTAGGNVGPLTPVAGGTTTQVTVTVPLTAPTGPGNFQVVNRPSYRASNAVAAVIGAVPTVTSVTVLGTTVTVTGAGFSLLSVINLYNLQGGAVVNLGGFGPGGAKVPLTVVSDTQFTFVRPARAAAGPAFVEVLNPPFIPFASSGNDPDGAFSFPPGPIAFGGLPATGTPVTTYEEGGFTVLATLGSWQAYGYGNPGPAIVFLRAAEESTTTAEVRVAAQGAPFTCQAVDLYSSITGIPYTVTGVLSSSTVFTFSGTVRNPSGNFVTVPSPYPAATIDSLFIRLSNPATPGGANPVGLDNIAVRR